MLKKTISNIFINRRFYIASLAIVLLFITGFYFDPVLLAARISLLILLLAVATDTSLLFFSGKNPLELVREVPERFSNGDENTISIHVRHNHHFPFFIEIVDELPFQFQIRNFTIRLSLKPGAEKQLTYKLRPVTRGEYAFGRTNVFLSGKIGLLSRRFIFNDKPVVVPVYPSFINIRKFEFLAISNRLNEAGIKRIRSIGQHSEFDQIREYVNGDDYRAINWKATAKKGKLMANQYQDERSQQIYNVIDMGRVMKMPFEGLSLLDYAINSSLVLANTAMLKHDKAGLITFNKNVESFLKAERRNSTMTTMMEALYNQKTDFGESDFEALYIKIKRMITHRSLIVIYTNFESSGSLERQLPFFQLLARNHLILVVIFENTEISELGKKEADSLEDIYTQTIAVKFMRDKNLIVRELGKHGILSVLTRPMDLSVSLVNKYLELKGRNML
ncbi:MAG: DUF58 domain-containing protein [Bacteroidales bacterium]